MRETEVIEQVMSELEDMGTVTINNKDGAYDMIREIRCYMGEREFYKFLEYSMRVWGFTQAEYFNAWLEEAAEKELVSPGFNKE